MNMATMDFENIPSVYRKQDSKKYVYGTAGFRQKASELRVVVFRVGILASLRSKSEKAVIGLMITASHNPEDDNGVKLIDPHGEMLAESWEMYATLLANASDEDLPNVVKRIIEDENIEMTQMANVYCAYDSRPSSVGLQTAANVGVTVCGGVFTTYGLLTTPQLHYIVRCANTDAEYGLPTEMGYYEKYSSAFLELNTFKAENRLANYENIIYVDGANGVGAVQMAKMAAHVSQVLQINIVNTEEGKLNHECGADYVKLMQKPPVVYTPERKIEPNQRWASLDGDGDRLVYFYLDGGGKFHLLDGDKIATLIAHYLSQLLTEANLKHVTVGMVQTAYANGSSTNYIKNTLNIDVFCVPTGVKHLHKKAQELDIGIYFEANGHGTVLFSDKVKNELSDLVSKKGRTPEQLSAQKRLKHFINLVNETVGDAIADLLIVETILCTLGWSTKDWNTMYNDLACRQLKVSVPDRSLVTTADAERQCVTPEGLQSKIDECVSKVKYGRAFVRPSGTEDIVRVYAEAETSEEADRLAEEIAAVVRELLKA